MVDTSTLRKGDLVFGLLSLRRYRVIKVDRCRVLVDPSVFRSDFPARPLWLNCQVLELENESSIND